MAAFLGDQIDAAMTGSPAGFPSIKAGDAKFLVASTELEIDGFPGEIITFEDVGVPYDVSIWMGVWAPAGISGERLNEVAAVFEEMANHPKWREAARKYGVTPTWMGPEEAVAYIEKSADVYGDLAKAIQGE